MLPKILIIIATIVIFCGSFRFKRVVSRKVSLLLSEKQWYERRDDVIQMPIESPVSIFDSLYNIDAKHDTEITSDITSMTLFEIANCYHFSLAFLGDYVCQLGCPAPIDINAKLGDMLTGEQIFSLLEAINTLDPYESNIDFDSTTLRDIARELDISSEKAIDICESEGFNLPFGLDTICHIAVAEKIREVSAYDEFHPFHIDKSKTLDVTETDIR